MSIGTHLSNDRKPKIVTMFKTQCTHVAAFSGIQRNILLGGDPKDEDNLKSYGPSIFDQRYPKFLIQFAFLFNQKYFWTQEMFLTWISTFYFENEVCVTSPHPAVCYD